MRKTLTNCATPSAMTITGIALFIQVSLIVIRRKKRDALGDGDSNPVHGVEKRAPYQRARASFVTMVGNKFYIYYFCNVVYNEEQMCDPYFSF